MERFCRHLEVSEILKLYSFVSHQAIKSFEAINVGEIKPGECREREG